MPHGQNKWINTRETEAWTVEEISQSYRASKSYSQDLGPGSLALHPILLSTWEMHCIDVFFSLYHTCVIKALTKVHVQKTNWNYHGVITVQADKNGAGRPVLPVHRVFVLLPFCCWAYHRTSLFQLLYFSFLKFPFGSSLYRQWFAEGFDFFRLFRACL